MAIIAIPLGTLEEVVESTITIEEKMHVKKKMTRYQLEEEQKPKQKGAKVMYFDTYCKGVYCQNCYNEGLFTKDCNLLNKIFHICKNNNHNTDQCPNKVVVGRCPTREIVQVHVVHAKGHPQHNYCMLNKQKQFSKQISNARSNSQI
jgi:hypothetical protein